MAGTVQSIMQTTYAEPSPAVATHETAAEQRWGTVADSAISSKITYMYDTTRLCNVRANLETNYNRAPQCFKDKKMASSA